MKTSEPVMYPTITMPADDGIQDLLTTMASGAMPATSEVSAVSPPWVCYWWCTGWGGCGEDADGASSSSLPIMHHRNPIVHYASPPSSNNDNVLVNFDIVMY